MGLLDRFTRSRRTARELAVQVAFANASLAIAALMTNHDVGPSELARRMGIRPQLVSRHLGGGQNLTLRSLACVAHALGCRVEINFVPWRTP